MTESFHPDGFQSPGAAFSPGPFWVWNSNPTEELITTNLDGLNAHGVDAVCLHPMPAAFRPHAFGRGMEIAYLGEEFFRMVSFAYQCAQERGMVVWLYDEGGWPSGAACGQVLESDPSLAACVLHLNKNGTTEVRCHPDLVDRLNPATAQAFIKLTHERYLKAGEEHFGKVVPWVFTDEPRFEGRLGTRDIPWYDALPDDFRKEAGVRLSDHLLKGVFAADPAKLTHEQRVARVHHMRCVSRRFVDSYFRPLTEWCEEHGVLHGGHLGGEDEAIAAVRHGFGDLSLCLDALDLPGMDTVWRQLFPGVRAHHFPKYASSSAHRCGRSRVLTESFAVYGQGLTLEQMKWITDFQYVRGANLMVFSNYPLSTHGPRMAATRTFLSPVNPLWKHFKIWADYTRRLSFVCCCGEPTVNVAVMDITSSLWAGPAEQIEARHNALVTALTESQIEFDYLPGTALSEKAQVLEEGTLVVGPMRYRTVITSQLSFVDAETWILLDSFVRAGGKLLVESGTGPLLVKCDELPEEAEALWEYVVHNVAGTLNLGRGRVAVGKVERLIANITPVVSTLEPTPWLRVMKRRDAGRAIYLLVNEGNTPQAGMIAFREKGVPKELNPETGSITAVGSRRLTSREISLRLEFSRFGSKIVLFDASMAKRQPQVRMRLDEAFALAEGWEARRLTSYEIENDDFVVRGVDEPWQAVGLGDWRTYFGDWFSGEVAYRVSFRGDAVEMCSAVEIDLGEVCYAAEVWLNGERIGSRAWAPFSLRVAGEKIVRQNQLEVRVTNTLANLMQSPDVRRDWAARQDPAYRNVYDKRATDFEKESLPSGLIGPVRLVPLDER